MEIQQPLPFAFLTFPAAVGDKQPFSLAAVFLVPRCRAGDRLAGEGLAGDETLLLPGIIEFPVSFPGVEKHSHSKDTCAT